MYSKLLLCCVNNFCFVFNVPLFLTPCLWAFHLAGTLTHKVFKREPAPPLRKISNCPLSAVLHPLMSAGLWRKNSRLTQTSSFDSKVMEQLNLIHHLPLRLLRTNQQLWIGWTVLISTQSHYCPLDGSQPIPHQMWQHKHLLAMRVTSTFLKMYIPVSCQNPLHQFTDRTLRSLALT